MNISGHVTRMAVNTKYAESRCVITGIKDHTSPWANNGPWWLRSTPKTSIYESPAMVVDVGGVIDAEGMDTGCKYVCVRPACWIDLSSPAVTYAGKVDAIQLPSPKFSKISTGKTSMTVKWKAQKTKAGINHITGYQIQYFDTYTYKRKTITVKGYTKSSKKSRNSNRKKNMKCGCAAI